MNVEKYYSRELTESQDITNNAIWIRGIRQNTNIREARVLFVYFGLLPLFLFGQPQHP